MANMKVEKIGDFGFSSKTKTVYKEFSPLASIKRIHNSDIATLDLSKKYYKKYDLNCLKPYGLWYGINDGWLDWCKDNMPKWVRQYNHVIRFKDNINLLTIDCSDQDQIYQFVKKYAHIEGKALSVKLNRVLWKQVVSQYDGIELINYHQAQDLRYTAFLWFYAWDCSSGCVWNLKKIKPNS